MALARIVGTVRSDAGDRLVGRALALYSLGSIGASPTRLPVTSTALTSSVCSSILLLGECSIHLTGNGCGSCARHGVSGHRAHAVLVLDGAGWHGSAVLTVPDNITLLHLPPYSPELNPVENVWAYLRANKLAITVFDTYDDIVNACCKAWNLLANDPSTIASIATRSWAQVS